MDGLNKKDIPFEFYFHPKLHTMVREKPPYVDLLDDIRIKMRNADEIFLNQTRNNDIHSFWKYLC